VFLLVDLRAPGSVRLRGTLRRGARRVRAVSLRVRPGSRRVRLPGARLKAGRYTLTLRAGDITRRVGFRVRAARAATFTTRRAVRLRPHGAAALAPPARRGGAA
jgi:hypothetical protein